MRAPSWTGPRLLWGSALSSLLCAELLLHSCRFYFSSPTVKGPFTPQCYQIFTLHWVILLPCSPKSCYSIDEQSHPSVAQEQNLLAQFLHLDCSAQMILLGSKSTTQTALEDTWAKWWPQKMTASTRLHFFLPPTNKR